MISLVKDSRDWNLMSDHRLYALLVREYPEKIASSILELNFPKILFFII